MSKMEEADKGTFNPCLGPVSILRNVVDINNSAEEILGRSVVLIAVRVLMVHIA